MYVLLASERSERDTLRGNTIESGVFVGERAKRTRLGWIMQDSVTKYLLALLNMILKGPNIEIETEIGTGSITAALSISLVMFNRMKHVRPALASERDTYRGNIIEKRGCLFICIIGERA